MWVCVGVCVCEGGDVKKKKNTCKQLFSGANHQAALQNKYFHHHFGIMKIVNKNIKLFVVEKIQ